jgi:hypothetical protein
MKFDVLHNFISPVTGRILCDPTYVLVGDSNGIAIPSPILSNILDASFVIGSPNASLPNAQVLDSLANGYIYNTAGIISTTPTVIPFLTEGHLWIGDATNTPTEYRTITIDNLPDLGQTIVPDPIGGGFVGQIWEGNNLGRPEISNRLGAMFADLVAINARFALAHFVLNEGNAVLRLAMPFSQFLEDLAPGGIAKIEATGQISIAVAGTDYLDVSAPPPGDGVIPILEPGPYPPNPKLIYPSTIHIIGTDDVIGINSLKGNILSAKNAVTSDDIMVSKNNIQTKELLLSDQTPAFTKFAILKGPVLLLNDVEWVLPDQQGIAGQVLTNTDGTQLQWANSNGNVSGPDPAVSLNESLAIWDGNTGRKIKDCAITVVGGKSIKNVDSLYVTNTITCTDIFVDNRVGTREVSFFDNGLNNNVSFIAPDVILNNVKWELPATSGEAGQVLTNTTGLTGKLDWTTTAPSNALYILQAGNVNLPNAQALDQLISAGPGDPRILKATDGGVVELAVERTDYGTVSGPAISRPENVAIWNIDGDGRTLEDSGFSIAELEALAEEAAVSAEESAASAVEASGAAADAAAEASAAAASATAAAASAAAALAISLFGVRRGRQGATGETGATGATGATGLTGAPGAAGASGRTTLIIDSNINVVGGRIQDIAASPQADYDAVNAKWVWDLLNDNVEIKWE